EVIAGAPSDAEAIDFYGAVQHVGVAPIVFFDSCGNVARVGNETRRTLGGAAVPLDEPVDDRTRQLGADVFVVGEREAANGIDVTYVHRMRRNDYAFGPRRRRTD